MKILVAGFGNPFAGDDGAGVKVLELIKNRKLPVDIYYGGTNGYDFIDIASRYDCVIIIDAVNFGGKPGSWFILPYESINEKYGFRFSLHHTSIIELIGIAKVFGSSTRFFIAGIEPKSIAFGEGLSKEVSLSLNAVASAIAQFLKELYEKNTCS